MNKKTFWAFPIRHVSIGIYANHPSVFNQVLIWIENEHGKSPRGSKCRCYENVSAASMKRLNNLIFSLNVNASSYFSQKHMDTFFYYKRVKEDHSRQKAINS